MSLLQIFYSIAGTVVGLLAIFIYSKNKKSPVNVTLAGFALGLSIWLSCSVLALFQKSYESALFWYKLSYSGIVFVPATAYDFATRFLGTKKYPIVRVLGYVFSSLFLIAIWSGNWLIKGLHSYSFGYYPSASYLVHPYLITHFVVFLGGMYVIFLTGYKSQKKENPTDIKLYRIKYALVALVVGNCASIDFLPNYGIPIYPIGFVFMTAMVVLFAYAILAYQFLDIEVIIRRTAVFAGLFAFVYGIFTVFTIISQEFFRNFLGWSQWVAMIPTAVIITFTIRPLENFLTNATEKFLFQKKYDYRELLKVFTNEILTVLDLQELTNRTIVGLNNIIKLESASVLLHDKEAKVYRAVASFGLKYKELSFGENDALISYVNATHQPIQRDKHSDKLEGHSELREDFVKLNARLCLPLVLHDELLGILTLGMKKSGEDYNQDDLDILSSLARTEAIAISNARLFDELAKTQAEAAQSEKMAVIGTLAAGINHEICNPLGIIRGQCEMFLLNIRDGFYKEKSPEEIMKIFMDISAKVIKETDRATGITKRLSSFAKPSKRSDMEEVIVDKEVEEVLGLIEHDLNLNNIEVVRNFPKSFPTILADRKQIEEVFFNIIRNAAQAMDKKDGRIVVSGVIENDSVVIRIVDNGSGIPKEKLDQIFHPFFTTKAPGKGTGLGLFIVKQIVEKNKGEIVVESEVGVGTTFILKFQTAAKALAA